MEVLSVDSGLALRVDLDNGFEIENQPSGTLAESLRALLSPPIPEWDIAGQRFWDFTGSDIGMPDTLILVDSDTDERLSFGTGPVEYEIVGTREVLARIMSGVDSLFDAVFGGRVTILGTMSQLSAMIGASWKVQLHG